MIYKGMPSVRYPRLFALFSHRTSSPAFFGATYALTLTPPGSFAPGNIAAVAGPGGMTTSHVFGVSTRPDFVQSALCHHPSLSISIPSGTGLTAGRQLAGTHDNGCVIWSSPGKSSSPPDKPTDTRRMSSFRIPGNPHSLATPSVSAGTVTRPSRSHRIYDGRPLTLEHITMTQPAFAGAWLSHPAPSGAADLLSSSAL